MVVAERVVVASGESKKTKQKNALFLSVPLCFVAVWFGFKSGRDDAY